MLAMKFASGIFLPLYLAVITVEANAGKTQATVCEISIIIFQGRDKAEKLRKKFNV